MVSVGLGTTNNQVWSSYTYESRLVCSCFHWSSWSTYGPMHGKSPRLTHHYFSTSDRQLPVAAAAATQTQNKQSTRHVYGEGGVKSRERHRKHQYLRREPFAGLSCPFQGRAHGPPPSQLDYTLWPLFHAPCEESMCVTPVTLIRLQLFLPKTQVSQQWQLIISS